MSPIAIKVVVALVVVATVVINPFLTGALVIAILAYHFFMGVDAPGIDPTTGESRTERIHSPEMALHHSKEVLKDLGVMTSGAIEVATSMANQYNTIERRKMEHINFSLKEDAKANNLKRAAKKLEWKAKANAIDADTLAKLDSLDAFLNTLKK